MRARSRAAVLAAALLVAPVAACGDAQQRDPAITLTVLAASSLADVLDEARAGYEEEQPDIRLRLSFAGSQELVAQIRQGLPADILITADSDTMDALRGRTGKVRFIAGNEMTIVTAPGNPDGIHDTAGLARPGLKVVLAAPEVPAGAYGREVLERAGVTVSPVSEEPGVRAVLGKVVLGEADAGLVYVTDAVAAGESVGRVPVPSEENVTVRYPAAALTDSTHPAQAEDFLLWLESGTAQRLLHDAGFQQP
ncbi:molybdate ABC transporter substrate-binding protein [Streptomyces sodiiphilus]|uniref:Molybdate ABC transporter substrate-binding protein n=1 Tax=Streptomyces sodiiphilus TaxID=226217 RepID=A0ABN2NXP2_9ACTN